MLRLRIIHARRAAVIPRVVAVLALCATVRAASPVDDASDALRAAVRFLRGEVSVEGSYLWTYSLNLRVRRGEGNATPTQGWVQPPGTPTIGLAFLRAYEAAREPDFLEAARDTAHALVATQLASGGWDYRIEFDPDRRRRWHYRADLDAGDTERRGRRAVSVYDDDNTQSAIRFLMATDRALDGADRDIRRAVDFALDRLLAAQYPNGAWPQRYNGSRPEMLPAPTLRARYPERPPPTYPGEDYGQHYTFNDGAASDIIATLLEAHRLYGRQEYLDAATRGGDFILLAQMPPPQPVWAQQYNHDMEPAWARRFEPPAVSAAESARVVRTLLQLHDATGDKRYGDAIGPALDWFRRSRLPDGGWARFYELRTNRPLYFTKAYELVYTDDDLPTHYSFRGDYGISRLLEEAERRLAADARATTDAPAAPSRRRLREQASAIVAAQDDRGRWVSDGVLSMRVFARNIETLARYVRAARASAE
jgi:hypothetical protein